MRSETQIRLNVKWSLLLFPSFTIIKICRQNLVNSPNNKLNKKIIWADFRVPYANSLTRHGKDAHTFVANSLEYTKPQIGNRETGYKCKIVYRAHLKSAVTEILLCRCVSDYMHVHETTNCIVRM